MMKEGRKRFMLHYNFPPYSVGEVGRIGAPSRRAIGHGYLAEGALRAVLPEEEAFPYIIRVVSEILESNGSSSMATVCSASLSLMDAGVPIRKPVAGVAMGMIQDEATRRRVILTDILGMEDHYGDMDFKVAGTQDGITAFQLDVKVGGIDRETLREALKQAKKARLAILAEMTQAIPVPRDHLSPYAPMLKTITIPVEKIGLVIGPGGRMIRQIIEETDAEIDIEDDGRVTISATDADSVAAAQRWIEDLTAELEVGTVIKTKVTRVVDFGAFVDLKNGSEGLVHVSNLSSGYVGNVRDIVQPGDDITVEVIGEDKMGRPDLRRVEEEGESARAPARQEKKESFKKGPRLKPPKSAKRIEVGDRIEGTVTHITDYGAFVELAPGVTGLVHISELSDKYVHRVEDVVNSGDRVTVEVLNIDERGRYKLRRVTPEVEKEGFTSLEAADEKPAEFEDRW
jgi:polyribonucleotide nucleotidyltransferase